MHKLGLFPIAKPCKRLGLLPMAKDVGNVQKLSAVALGADAERDVYAEVPLPVKLGNGRESDHEQPSFRFFVMFSIANVRELVGRLLENVREFDENSERKMQRCG